MKVFISWSGRRSHEVADALAGWLKKVVQSADPWVSSEMERGVKWLAEVGKSLDDHSIGILCVTPGNVRAPWLNFEAGALSKQIGDDVRVIPYLLDFHSASELQPPLGQFNASLADEHGTYELVTTLNAHSEKKLSDADLDDVFQMWWTTLHTELEDIRASGSGQAPDRRSTDDKVNELLDLTRQLMRRLPTSARNELNLLRNRVGQGPTATPWWLIASENDPRAGLLGGAGLLGEDALNVGGFTRPLTEQDVAAGVVAETLRQAGLDVNAMEVMKADDLGIWIYVPQPPEPSVLEKVREALKATLPKSSKVDFYTAGETQIKLIDEETEVPPDGAK